MIRRSSPFQCFRIAVFDTRRFTSTRRAASRSHKISQARPLESLPCTATMRACAEGHLSDEYGVTRDQCRWIVGGLDLAPIDFIPQPRPANVDVTPAPGGKDLGEM